MQEAASRGVQGKLQTGFQGLAWTVSLLDAVA